MQNGHFFNFFLLGNIGQEKIFVFDILERKNAFLGDKNQKFKQSKNCLFSKGVTHGFGPTMAVFPTSFFQAKQATKMSFTISQKEKTPFKAMKTRSSKSRRIAFFSKGLTHGFGPKMAIFSTTFFLGNICQENVLYDILDGKNAFLGYKNKKYKKSKNYHYSKGVDPWFWCKNGHFFNFFILGITGQKKCLLRYFRTRKRLSSL